MWSLIDFRWGFFLAAKPASDSYPGRLCQIDSFFILVSFL